MEGVTASYKWFGKRWFIHPSSVLSWGKFCEQTAGGGGGGGVNFGRKPRPPPPPLFLDETEFENLGGPPPIPPPPPPLISYLKVWIQNCNHQFFISVDGDRKFP